MQTLKNVCLALDKYCVKFFPTLVRMALLRNVDKHAESIYVLSCDMNLKDVIGAAAKALICKTYDTAHIPSAHQEALRKFRNRCITTAIEAISAKNFYKNDIPGVSGTGRCPNDCNCQRNPITIGSAPSKVWTPYWILKLVEGIRSQIRSTNAVYKITPKSEPVLTALRSASNCLYCHQAAPERMYSFIDKINAVITSQVSQVGVHK
jgi:hypothetical protein